MATGKRGRPSAAPAAGPANDEAAGPGPGSTASGIVALHRSRMFDWKPSAVVAIAPCPGAPLFAVGYENGSLELWDMLQLICTQTVAGPSLELTSLAWARDSVSNGWRTFAAFLDGTVAEVVWRQGAVAHAQESYGGVVWGLAASPASAVKPGFSHTLAAACDDGSVRLFGCEGGEPGLVHERVLARLQGRLLCCAWHAGGTMLAVGGSAGNIHVLDAATGRELQLITASASSSRPVTVWRLLWLPDGTLVSGDSDGATQLWDPRFGTLLFRFAQHKADVLALAATEDGATVFAAGVDSQVAMFTRVPSSEPGMPDSWAYTHYKRPHTHDVRALAMVAAGGDRGGMLLSGGVDAQLIAYPASKFLQQHPTRLCKCPQRPACQVAAPLHSTAAPAAPPPRLLVTQHDTMDVWQLAEAASVRQGGGGPPFEGEPLELLSAPRHLARIRVKGARVASASLSPSGAFVAAATPSGTRAYALDGSAATAASAVVPAPAVTRLKLAAAAEDAAALAVAATDAHLVLALPDGGLMCVELPSGAVAARAPARAGGSNSGATTWTADAHAWRNYCPPAAQLVAAADGSMVAAVGCNGISLHRLPGLESHGRLLRSEAGAFTAVAFSRDARLVAAATSNCQLLVWDTADCKQVPWCVANAEAATAAISRLPGTPTCISFCPVPTAAAAAQPAAATAGGSPSLLPYRLVVNSSGGMVHFDLSRPVDDTYLQAKQAGGRRQRGRLRPDQRSQPEDRPESRGSNGRVIRTMHPAVWLGHVGPADLLLLEKPWEEVLTALPPPLFTHRYGS